MTIREAITQGSICLKNNGNKTPSLDSSLLLACILGITRTEIIAKGTEPFTDQAYKSFLTLLERRKNGECIAYITGKKEFWNLEFYVNNHVLIPRPDTEILVEEAIKEIKKKEKEKTKNESLQMLDLCTGSGAIAISVKHELPFIEVYAVDICANALEVAQKNAECLLGENLICFYHGDLYNALPSANRTFSLIVTNPPYIPTDEILTLSQEVQNEPRIALDGGRSGLKIIKRVINSTPLYLNNGGRLLMEADPQQMQDIIILLDKRGFTDIKLYKDLNSLDRVIGGTFES
jgi:release factor glutamine methyltransferase